MFRVITTFILCIGFVLILVNSSLGGIKLALLRAANRTAYQLTRIKTINRLGARRRGISQLIELDSGLETEE